MSIAASSASLLFASFIIFVCSLQHLSAASEQHYSIASQGMHLQLPSVFKVKPATFDIEALRTLDFTDHHIALPATQKAGADTNAWEVQCPGDAYAVIFRSEARFSPHYEFVASLREQCKQAAAKRGVSSDEVLQCADYATLIDGVNALEVMMRRVAPVSDKRGPEYVDVFSEIALVSVENRNYGVIFRSFASAAPETQTAEHLMFQQLLNALRIDEFHSEAKTIRRTGLGMSLNLPKLWPDPLYKEMKLPLVELPGGSVVPINDKGVSHEQSDSTWNTVVVQLPSLQLQVSSFKLNGISTDSMRSKIYASLRAQAGLIDPSAIVNEDAVYGSNKAMEISLVQIRRGKVIHRFVVLYKDNACIVARATCWQRDYSLVQHAVDPILSSIKFED